MEWCSNTLPLGTILIGADRKSGVHYRYYPTTPNYAECQNFYTEKKTPREKMFKELCAEVSPAFKFFFLEKFKSPVEHYLAR